MGLIRTRNSRIGEEAGDDLSLDPKE
jgi:hypothetical protein